MRKERRHPLQVKTDAIIKRVKQESVWTMAYTGYYLPDLSKIAGMECAGANLLLLTKYLPTLEYLLSGSFALCSWRRRAPPHLPLVWLATN